MPDPEETLTVFDCHHHVGAFYSEGPGVEPDLAEMHARVEIMTAGGVTAAAVMPGHSYDRSQGIADTRRQNDRIAAYRATDSEHFPVIVAVAEPAFGDAALGEIERCAEELDADGITIHARFQGVANDDKRVVACVRRAADVGLVPVVHALAEVPDESIWKVLALADAVPEARILALDAFNTFLGISDAFEVARRSENILFDTSLTYSFDYLEPFADEFGSDRLVFGTDLYSPPVGRRISHILAQIRESRLSQEAKQRIVYDNAANLFGLPVTSEGDR